MQHLPSLHPLIILPERIRPPVIARNEAIQRGGLVWVFGTLASRQQNSHYRQQSTCSCHFHCSISLISPISPISPIQGLQLKHHRPHNRPVDAQRIAQILRRIVLVEMVQQAIT